MNGERYVLSCVNQLNSLSLLIKKEKEKKNEVMFQQLFIGHRDNKILTYQSVHIPERVDPHGIINS